MMATFLGSTFQKAVEIITPIIAREVAKPRFRAFIEEKAGDVAIEVARRFTTKKSKKFIKIKRGNQNLLCRRVR